MNKLRAAKLNTVEDILRLGQVSIFRLNNVGVVIAREVEEKIFAVYS
jgi:hypothetical protein